jgi:hypothetical protein
MELAAPTDLTWALWRLRSVRMVMTELGPVEAVAPMEPSAAAPTLTWPAAYRRPATDWGGAPIAAWLAAHRRPAVDRGGELASHTLLL